MLSYHVEKRPQFDGQKLIRNLKKFQSLLNYEQKIESEMCPRITTSELPQNRQSDAVLYIP